MELISHPLFGIVSVPPSKSDAQRAILAAALTNGETSTLQNCGQSKDELAMLSCIETLGARIEKLSSSELKIIAWKNDPESKTLNVHESGLAFRLITSICSVFSVPFTILGEGSLANRTHQFFLENLPKLGVKVESNNGKIPFTVQGPLIGNEIELDGSQGSQFISGLVMALPLSASNSHLIIKNLKSRPYLEMTLHTLEQFGIIIQRKSLDELLISGNQKYLACNYTIEGDWSAASCWFVAAALGQEITISGLQLTSLQADKAILKALESANCKLIYSENGITVDGENRLPLNFDATDCPDLFPALVCYASLTEGVSILKGVSRLANKESDRGKVLRSEFGKLGVEIAIEKDSMFIHGKKSLKGAKVSSKGDHRIAMSLAIASLYTEEPIELEGFDAVEKSYPDFWKDFKSLIV